MRGDQHELGLTTVQPWCLRTICHCEPTGPAAAAPMRDPPTMSSTKPSARHPARRLGRPLSSPRGFFGDGLCIDTCAVTPMAWGHTAEITQAELVLCFQLEPHADGLASHSKFDDIQLKQAHTDEPRAAPTRTEAQYSHRHGRGRPFKGRSWSSTSRQASSMAIKLCTQAEWLPRASSRSQ